MSYQGKEIVLMNKQGLADSKLMVSSITQEGQNKDLKAIYYWTAGIYQYLNHNS